MNLARVKFLGIYLIAICSLQICLYFIVILNPDDRRVLLNFEPRIGTFFLEAMFRAYLSSAEPVIHSIFNWLTAVWILTLGIFLSLGRPLLKTYIISEIIFFLPTLLLNLTVAAVMVRQMAFQEVLYVLIPLFFSIIPLVWAIWLAWGSISEQRKKF